MSESPNEFYANAVNIMANLYDLTLSFRAQTPVLVDPAKPPMIQSSNECNVRMSPQHAKALAALLVDQVQKYEEQFNIVLPIEDNIAGIWKSLSKKG